MTDLLAARSQMAVSLAFHIVFAALGIALPVLMCVAEWRARRTGDPGYRALAKRWAKGTAILFAVGAVSGTVLSFELGLLWPTFMARSGAAIGLPFALEGFAFFTEAIFLGIYLYGWDRVPPRAHLAAGIIVAVSGTLSGIFVVLVNAWMNAPVGFALAADGTLRDVDPLRAMGSPAALAEALHMTLAAYAATGMAVAGVHALLLRRPATRADRVAAAFHRRALGVALLVGAPSMILQAVAGHYSAATVARVQPVKLAALEGQWTTMRGAPLRIGGWPDERAQRTRWALEIPYGLSLLAFDDPHALVRGLGDVPPNDRPPVLVTHLAFQTMVGCGMLSALVAAWALWALYQSRRARRAGRPGVGLAGRPRLLLALGITAPAGFVAIEAGWVVTEVGRQPWIVQGVLRTADAVTPMPGLVVPFAGFTLLYVLLAAVVVWLLRRQIDATERTGPGRLTAEYPARA
ncbi:cytochrome bd ubiquinol oxidase subunit I [Gemmatirosa kalamazoonensis]|uniref:Cytochrome bd ubiquinol oxidase subunit I n=1 Tax=Gemmatirosa kalamazoonensis TaxID=861299 RepID=W0RCQ5_9BACT|nr:cytochrome ubiquinol oxidase subunit I [Gemmatirosa kalamazoonensis]AHG88105.1 cytochrome bd ubiquinol oxidase subunit I [Gemmatirosa kalamazoonensis]